MSWFTEFPFKVNIDVGVIDKFIRNLKNSLSHFFNAIKNGLDTIINSIYVILNFIPWWVYLILVFFIGWKLGKKLSRGFIYTLAMLFIGLFNLWDLMIETLSIVIAAVIISLIIGFPIGILLSKSNRADKIIRPVLDTMQTMPVFIYLIPAVIFFGLGKAPAVLATTIYAVVPLIRLTNHGIKMVDAEVVEAAKAFGSTSWQTLIKVQIPQALPTIMTGVNQTIMMAMSMVVTTSMIGVNGLGMEGLIGVQRMELGRGLIAGIAVVILAIILDRLTQGLVKKEEGVLDE